MSNKAEFHRSISRLAYHGSPEAAALDRILAGVVIEKLTLEDWQQAGGGSGTWAK